MSATLTHPREAVSKTILSWLNSVVIMAALFGIGVWGHRTHWTLPGMGGGHSEPHAAKHNPETPSGGTPGVPPQALMAAAVPVPGAGVAAAEGAAAQPVDDSDVVKFGTPEAKLRMGVITEKAVRSNLRDTVTANGVVSFNENRIARLSSRAPGVVWRVEREAGQLVKKGDVLAIINSADVGRAKAELLQAAIDLAVKRKTAERLKSIGDVVAEREIRDADAAVREAKFRLFNAEQVLLNLGMPSHLTEAEIENDEALAKKVQFLGLPDDLSKQLDPETTTANLIAIVAPFDGVVVERDIVTGEVVDSTKTEFVVADVTEMWVELSVREEDARRLSVNQKARFLAEGANAPVECTLTFIGTEVDPKTRTVRVRATAANPITTAAGEGRDGQRLLRANVFGTGEVLVGQHDNAILVPHEAVQFDGERHLVFLPLPDGLSFRAVEVETGVRSEGMTEIVSGLTGEQEVVTEGGYVLKSELQRVRQALASR